jgi:RNA polymerase sigma factor for flagellar operon FliA
MPSSASAAPSSTACATWTGAPRELRRKARRLELATQNLQTELGRSATEPELAHVMEMTLEEFQHMLDDIRGLEVASLQVESLEDGRTTDLSENLPGPANQDPLLLCMQQERKHMLAGAIAQLPPREQEVLALYYQEELTMKEVGAVLGVGESRVSQIHSAAVARLRVLLAGMQQTGRPVLTSAARAADRTQKRGNGPEVREIPDRP